VGKTSDEVARLREDVRRLTEQVERLTDPEPPGDPRARAADNLRRGYQESGDPAELRRARREGGDRAA
jgi:hypothetical protein